MSNKKSRLTGTFYNDSHKELTPDTIRIAQLKLEVGGLRVLLTAAREVLGTQHYLDAMIGEAKVSTALLLKRIDEALHLPTTNTPSSPSVNRMNSTKTSPGE